MQLEETGRYWDTKENTNSALCFQRNLFTGTHKFYCQHRPFGFLMICFKNIGSLIEIALWSVFWNSFVLMKKLLLFGNNEQTQFSGTFTLVTTFGTHWAVIEIIIVSVSHEKGFFRKLIIFKKSFLLESFWTHPLYKYSHDSEFC